MQAKHHRKEVYENARRLGTTLAETCSRWIESTTGRTCLLGTVAIIYLLAYLGHPVLPGANHNFPLGWWGWSDQGWYLKCAASLAHASLNANSYLYSLGYPVMGALFYHFAPDHAFLLPDLLLVLGIAALFYRISTHFVTPIEAVLGMAIFLICYRQLLSSTLVIPWNTIPTHFFSYAIISLVSLSEPNKTRILFGSAFVALIYLCRPADALCLAIPIGIAILRLRTFAAKAITAFAVAVMLTAVVASVLLINHSVFGSWRTPYEKIVAAFGFGSYSFAQKAFLLIADGNPVFRERDTALILHYPWLLLIVPGTVHLFHRYKTKINALGISLAIFATYVIYFEYNGALWPGNIFRYLLIHYISWTLPLLALVTYIGLKEAWRYRAGRWSFLSVPLLLFCVSFITLHEKATWEVLQHPLPISEITLQPKPTTDWIEFRGPRTVPALSTEGSALVEPRDFIPPLRMDGVAVMLSSNARSKVIEVKSKVPEEIQGIRFGQLCWRLQWLPYWAVPVLIKNFIPPEVLPLGKSANVDLAGPLGLPDGQPDEVIRVTLRRWVLRRIATWEIETEFQHRHWISTPNWQGWWLIRPDISNPPEIAEGHSVVRLCFPDFGDFERAPEFTLRALDAEGRTIFEQTIRK